MTDGLGKTCDKLLVQGLEVMCIIGVEQHERLRPQLVVVDLELLADLSRACLTDSVFEAPDYAVISSRIIKEMSETSYRLLEAFAERVSEICLDSHGCVKQAVVRVKKPEALSALGNAVATVEITRNRESRSANTV